MRTALVLSTFLVLFGCAVEQPAAVTATGARAATAAPAFVLPQGNPAAGHDVLAKMSCYSCHEVVGGDFPAPVADPPVPVKIDATVAAKSPEQIAESIIAPSHRFPRGVPGIDSDGLSRMGDYSEAMTVRELIDLVAYIRSLHQET